MLLAVLCITVGCSPRQDYKVVPRERADDIFRGSKVVLDGHVMMARATSQATFADYFFFWLPMPASTANPRYDATIIVDEVLKGDEHPWSVELQHYRPLTPAERALLSGYHDILNGLRLRVGYDRRRGNSLTRLVLCPLGLTTEVEEAMRRANALRARSGAPASHATKYK
jgi:hypothetical protein